MVLEVNASGDQVGRNIYDTNLLMRTADGLSLYYMYNGHADVTALIDATTGTTRATYYYDAFGNIQEQKYYTASGTETTTPINNSIMYAGYQYDKETGLYYLNARMYDPKIARFLQEDTYSGSANDPLSLNLYTYCYNNPIIYYDPTGHGPQSEAVEIGFKYILHAEGPDWLSGILDFTDPLSAFIAVMDMNTMVIGDSTLTDEQKREMEKSAQIQSAISSPTIGTAAPMYSGPDSYPKVATPSYSGPYSYPKAATENTNKITMEKSKPTILTSPPLEESKVTILTSPFIESTPTILALPPQSSNGMSVLTWPDQQVNGLNILTSPGIPDTSINVLPIGSDITNPIDIYGRMQNVSELDFIGGDNFKVVKLPHFGYTGYRKTFFEAYPNLKGEDLVIHHGIEQQVLDRFKDIFTFEEIQDITNLRGIPIEINSEVHLSKIRKIWDDFYADILDGIIEPTKENFLKKRKEIDDLLGDQFKPKIR